MRAALLEHDEVLRDAIESHGGFLFSHTGDGVVAAFASPKSAAITAQRALEAVATVFRKRRGVSPGPRTHKAAISCCSVRKPRKLQQ
jgi:class 3 adenylate cyclase